MINENSPSGKLFSFITSANIFCTAIAVNGTLEDGFQRFESPHTVASIEFQDHTATGKLNALIIPTIPNG